MSEERRNQLIWGVMLLVGALGSASLRNNPEIGITPLAVGVIEALIYVCILTCVRISDWRISSVIAIITPVYLWVQRFLDGFMVPVEIMACMTMVLTMWTVQRLKPKYPAAAALLAVPAFVVLLLGSTIALWIVRQEGAVRSFVMAWNTVFYSGISILAAALMCAPISFKKQQNKDGMI